ncbi:MAG TPA: MOSC N-terminal beta barrel domain-containing protein [Usitatibacter sp.]|nr:MOSC N-terminal beta barrel domain-containing protein [Usitatibacter sp.]
MPITVAALHVYPVKGLKGIDLEAARCTGRGLEHDRRWMVVDAAGEFMSQREHPRMATVWTELAAEALVLSAPDMPEVGVPLAPPPGPARKVRVWNSVCDALDASAEADAWLSRYLGVACRLVYMPETTRRPSNPEFAGEGELVGFADGYAYLLVGEASLADLNARLAARGHPALPMNRFRPNVVLRGSDAYAEDAWGDVRVGSAVLRGVKPCGRCAVTTTDQATGEVRGPEPLATLATYRDSARFGVMFGMNFVTVREGRIALGDRLEAA